MQRSFDDVWRGHEQGLKDWQADVGRMPPGGPYDFRKMSEAIVDVLLESGQDEMLPELARVAIEEPWRIAQNAWDSYEGGDTPWRAVFHALGYSGYEGVQMARTMEEAEEALGETGDSDFYDAEAEKEWSWELIPMFQSFKMPSSHIAAIKRLWDHHRSYGLEGEGVQEGAEDSMVGDVAKAGMESPDAVIRRAWQKGQHLASYTTDDNFTLAKPYYGWYEVLKALGHTDYNAAMTLARFQAMIPLGLPADTAWTDASTQLMGMGLTNAQFQALHRLFMGTV